MSKTALFSRLQRLAQQACSPASLAASPALQLQRGRRAFLRGSAVALSRAALPSLLLAGCRHSGASEPAADASTSGDGGHDGAAPIGTTRVAIIGGGMAGLHCAYRLKQAGVIADVYEASERTGGRMFTARDMFPEGQIAELGGELIDSIHVTMRKLAEEFDLTLDDRDATGASIDEVWWVEGKAVPEAMIVSQFSAVAPLIASLSTMADEDGEVYAELDALPLATWLDDNLTAQPELHSVLTNAYRGEYGLETKEQSALNLIYLIGADDPDPFRIFGDSDERYHCHTGSQSFPDKLTEQLADQISLGQKLTTVKKIDDGFQLIFEDAQDRQLEVEVDHVVFALPFSTLRKVDLAGASISPLKRQIIDELGYGKNAKVMGSFRERVWLTQHDASGSVTSDEAFQQCWDTAPGQAGKSGILTNFVAGDQGVKSGEGSAETWYTQVMVPGAEKVFPGAQAAYVNGSAVRMHWPSYAFNLGSYACYRPGQWAFYGREGEREGNLHFCGEHCSLDFQGFMEGAAETGALVAAAILGDLKIELPKALSQLMDVKLALPQPALGALRDAPRFWARRREILHLLATG